MANLYRVVYRTSGDSLTNAIVAATTEDNAWAAVQSNDSTASNLESMDEERANIIIGS